jgi:hypothetical protein
MAFPVIDSIRLVDIRQLLLQNDEAEGRSGDTGGSSAPGNNSGGASATVNSPGVSAGLANADGTASGNTDLSILVDECRDMTAAMIYDAVENLSLQRQAIRERTGARTDSSDDIDQFVKIGERIKELKYVLIERDLPPEKEEPEQAFPAGPMDTSPAPISEHAAPDSSWADITPQEKSSGASIPLNSRNRNPAHTGNYVVGRPYFAKTSSRETAP